MNTGIKPKTVVKGRQHDEFARRYIFYPLSNLKMHSTQYESPIWNPNIPKGRFVLLEACEYQAPVSGDGEVTSGVSLEERMMGTDAQVRFLMGTQDGVGYMEKGMTNLDSMVDLDAETAVEVESMILPTDKDGNVVVPETLIKFKAHLDSVTFEGENPVIDVAKKALAECKAGVNRAMAYCRSHTSQMEQELADGQNGGFGMKFLTDTNKYYFHQIEKPLPEDRQGTNMGSELAKVLAPLIAQAGGNAAPAQSNVQASVELAETQKKLAQAEATLKEQAEVIETLTNESEQPTATE